MRASREDVDACIHSDTMPPVGARFHRLFGKMLLPVCSPRLLQRETRLDEPRDLARHVLVSSMHRPRDWPTWLTAAGVPDIDGNNGIKVENSALMNAISLYNIDLIMSVTFLLVVFAAGVNGILLAIDRRLRFRA